MYNIWRILPGIFLAKFFWALFPTKMRRKNPATKSAKKSGGLKIKIREKSVLQKSDPNSSFVDFDACKGRTDSPDPSPFRHNLGFRMSRSTGIGKRERLEGRRQR